MSVQCVNGHVFLPQQPNWQTPLQWQRTWANEVVTGLTGIEARSAMRSLPRVQLTWTVTPWTVPAQNELDDQVRAAKKAGLACAPYWGRASVLASPCSGTAVVLQSAFWPWKVGDWICFLYPLSFDLRQVTAVVGSALTLNAAVSSASPANTLVWPLLYGKLTTNDMSLATGQRGALQLTLLEETPGQAAQLGGVPPPPGSGSGIGSMSIGSTFNVT